MTISSSTAQSAPADVFDEALATYRPFADSNYIRGRMHAAYERRLGKIASTLPGAEHLVQALREADESTRYKVLGDTALRCAIQHALRQVVTGLPYGLAMEDYESVFEAAAGMTADGARLGLLEQGSRLRESLGSQEWHGYIWDESHGDDPFARVFRQVVQDNYGDELVTPDEVALRTLRQAAELLTELAPQLARSALSHAHVIAVFPARGGWRGKASSSQYRISGTIFISRGALGNPWWVAEHLLHESLHQKLYDFRHGHSLLTRDSADQASELTDDGARFESIWNMPGTTGLNLWDTHRALAAFHVYVHLAFLGMMAERRSAELEARYGPIQGQPPVMTQGRKAFDRAHCLFEGIDGQCLPDLGLAGRRLVQWLADVLDALDDAPPPPGAHAHLLLDRYLLEVQQVQHARSSPTLDNALEALSSREVDLTGRLLQSLTGTSRQDVYPSAVPLTARDSSTERFAQIRVDTARMLRAELLDGYRFAGSAETAQHAENALAQMIDESSRRLATALAEG